MIEIKFKTSNGSDIAPHKELLHNALVGSPAYVESEIVLSDGDAPDECILIIGQNCEDSANDLSIGINVDPISSVIDEQAANEAASVEEEYPICEECSIPSAEE